MHLFKTTLLIFTIIVIIPSYGQKVSGKGSRGHGNLNENPTDTIAYRNVSNPTDPTARTSKVSVINRTKEVHSSGSSVLADVLLSTGFNDVSGEQKQPLFSKMEMFTTTGSGGDIVPSIQLFPGVQYAEDITGLVVRGGEAGESVIVLDGMTVQNPYYSDVPGLAQRSRYKPFQFRDISFNNGWFRARYGQALSSVLALKTTDVPEVSNVDIDLNFTGLTVSGVKKWDGSAFRAGVSLRNLMPYYHTATSNYDFYKSPAGGDLSMMYLLPASGDKLLKIFYSGDFIESGTKVFDPFNPGNLVSFDLLTKHNYMGASIEKREGKWQYFAGGTFDHNQDRSRYQNDVNKIYNTNWRVQFRGEGMYYPVRGLELRLGMEVHRYRYGYRYRANSSSFDETYVSVYQESEWEINDLVSLYEGIRVDHSDLVKNTAVAPRLGLAFRVFSFGQLSMSGGLFYQQAANKYLLSGYTPDLQKATHYTVNYTYEKQGYHFRVEWFHKSYDQMVRELAENGYDPNPYRFITGPVDNSGYGHSEGLEIFWMDKHSVKNIDYGMTYSFLDTKRLYENFLQSATPAFASDHNMNVHIRCHLSSRLDVGCMYKYASGRPYYDPTGEFMKSRTPEFHNLSLNFSYLTSLDNWGMVFYGGIENLLNRENIVGFQFKENNPAPVPVLPELGRSYYLGIRMSLP